MSRKSKRRRMRNPEGTPQAPRPDSGDGFDFLDDRAAPAAAPLPVIESTISTPIPEKRIGSVPALRRDPVLATGSASEDAKPEAPVAPFIGTTATLAEDEPTPPSAAAAPATPEPTVTIGEVLASRREARGLTIEEASSRTRIPMKMLAHLENDRFGEFAADTYARGFLRSYASFLGLDPQKLLVRYEQLYARRSEPATPVAEKQAPVVVTRRSARPRPASRRRTVVSIAVGAVAVLVVAGSYLAQRGVVRLRPAAGLQQIEDELRQAQDVPSTGAVPTPPATGVLPESTGVVDASTAGTEPAGEATSVPTAAPQPAAAKPQSPAPGAPTVTGTVTSQAQPVVRRELGRERTEDTSPKPLPPVQSSTDRHGLDTARVTDLTEVPEPVPPPAPQRERAPEPVETAVAPPPVDDGRPLTLTATALDSCVLRVQVDTNARAARRHVFTRRGETRSWVAKQSFRVLAQPSRNVELRLNGRLIPAPADGRTVIFDRTTLQPAARTPSPARTPNAAPNL